ncbi:MAG: type II toxin-antitoxin system VapC family toxin [Candidatus Planktophila sp.]|nr:type II toxin-antitoxin system VapC family toxin [Candidatus Planktophila sp.]
MSWYADSSALLKLLIVEKESVALTDFIDFTIKSSVLTRVEVIRTLHKIAPEKITDAQIILDGIDLTPVNPAILNVAENFSPSITLKSLDALHIATVIFLDKSVEGVITYDKAMIKNAKELGIKVISPGMK